MITLSGLPYRAASPSHFEQVGYPTAITYIGRPCRAEASGEGGWLIAVRGVYGTREFNSRDEAARLIAQAFTIARENLA